MAHGKRITKRSLSPLEPAWQKRYENQMYQAIWRGEEWAFDPESWWWVWCQSGVIVHRSRRVQGYCMVRVDVLEAWGPHNSIIVTRRELFRRLAPMMRGAPAPTWDWCDAV